MITGGGIEPKRKPPCRVHIATVIIFLLLASFWVLKDGLSSNDGSSWLWRTSGSSSSSPESQELLRALEDRLKKHTTAQLQALLLQRGGDARPPPPSTDVNRLLAMAEGDAAETEQLRKLQYCSKFEGMSKVPKQFMDPWLPSGKFLMPLCYYGQISNRLMCMRTYLLFAALLNRTLVIPEAETGPLGYRYDLVIDVQHARRCIGDTANVTVISLSEYRARIAQGEVSDVKKVRVVVDQVLCWKAECAYSDVKKIWGNRGSDVVTPLEMQAGYGSRVRSVQDLVEVYGGIPDRLISMGDLFGAGSLKGLPPSVRNRPTLPFPNMSCSLFMQPHTAIVQAAKGFVRTILGPDFMAIHLRRGDFHGFWNRGGCRDVGDTKMVCQIRPIQVVARCILEKLGGTNISVVFAATNSFPMELDLLQKLLLSNRPPVALLTLPTNFTQQTYRWARNWKRLQLDRHPLAFATMDKLVCAMSKIFMGTVKSTFTDDIVIMRAALGTLSCQDQDLCSPFLYQFDTLPFFNETDDESKLMFRK